MHNMREKTVQAKRGFICLVMTLLLAVMITMPVVAATKVSISKKVTVQVSQPSWVCLRLNSWKV